MVHFIHAQRLRVAHTVFSVCLFFRRGGDVPNARSISRRTDCRGILVSTAPGVSVGFGYTYAGPAFVLDGASNTVCVLGVFALAA